MLISYHWIFLYLSINQNTFFSDCRWVGEYTYNDAHSYKNIDIVWKQGGPKGKESKTKAATTISYGILTVSERSFEITFSKPGFAYRPVTMQPDPEMQVFLAKKLNYPEQIHLAYGKDPTTAITVSWVTTYATSRTVVQYGLSSGNYQFQATGTWTEYKYKKYKSGAIHSVFITGLKPGIPYYHYCCSCCYHRIVLQLEYSYYKNELIFLSCLSKYKYQL